MIVYFAGNRARFKTKNSRLNFIFASNLAVVVLLIVAIVAAVNYLGTRVHKRFDFTAGRVHSLSDQSIQVAKRLKKDLTIKAFFSKGPGQPGALQLPAGAFTATTATKIKATVIDPYLKPELVKQYDIKTDGTMVFEYDGKSTRSEEVSEEAITNAIINVSRPSEKTIYFTQGHGEPDIDAAARNGILRGQVRPGKAVLQGEETGFVPGSGRARGRGGVVVAGPAEAVL